MDVLKPPDARSVARAFRLDGYVGELVPVGGAWSNRVFRLTVGSTAYAVKELRNPWAIAHRRGEWLDEAWAFERRAIEAGVTAPLPVPAPKGAVTPRSTARAADPARCESTTGSTAVLPHSGSHSRAGASGWKIARNVLLVGVQPVLCDWDVASPLGETFHVRVL